MMPNDDQVLMYLPASLRNEVGKWAGIQGVSFDEFVVQAIAEKVNTLTQQSSPITLPDLQTRRQWLARIRQFRMTHPLPGESLSTTVIKIRQEERY